MIVRELAPLERFLAPGVEDGEESSPTARVHRLRGPERPPDSIEDALDIEEQAAAAVGSSIRAVAPPVQSFGNGRRR